MSMYGNDIFYYRDYLMLNEAFVGKTPILEDIEKKIGEARKKIKYYSANNTLKEVLEINRLFEKQFGMEVYALQIYPSNTVNAYTQVLAANFDIAEDIIMHDWVEANSSMGYRFKKDNNFCILVNIATSLICDEQYTDEEIVAILLHELGHNFADCIYDDIELANRNMMIAYKKYLIYIVIIGAILSVISFGLFAPTFINSLLNLTGKKFNNEKKNNDQTKKQSREGSGMFAGLIEGINAKIHDINNFIGEFISWRWISS